MPSFNKPSTSLSFYFLIYESGNFLIYEVGIIHTRFSKLFWKRTDSKYFQLCIPCSLCLSKTTADSDCNHEIKRDLLLERKAMTNLDRVLKSRDITLLIQVHLVKAMVFPVDMYACDSWTIKKAECQRIDAFELWCWRRLLRVSWTARRPNSQS